MNNNIYILTVIIVAAIITFLLRVAPFAFFSKVNMPQKLQTVVKLLPAAIIAVLVIYCIKSITTSSALEAIITIGSCGVVVLLHLWKKNTLLSIAGGTIIYMILLRLFII